MTDEAKDLRGGARRLEGRVALVTGAASGIGQATALRLAEEGAKIVCADINEAGLEETLASISAAGGEATSAICDVSNEDSVKDTVAKAATAFDGLHILANIGGILRFDNTHQLTLDNWSKVIGVNLTGTFLMCREAIPHLLEHPGKGIIINMSSTSALGSHAWTAAYAASKGGVLSMTKSLAVEYAKQGLRVNVVCPGAITTPIVGSFQWPEGVDQSLIQKAMFYDKFRGPEYVASVIAFLASEDGAHINGTELRIDGGMMA